MRCVLGTSGDQATHGLAVTLLIARAGCSVAGIHMFVVSAADHRVGHPLHILDAGDREGILLGRCTSILGRDSHALVLALC